MLETLTGLGLASAAGLNAYIPMLVLGLLDRFTGLVDLPGGWGWLGNEWVLIIVGVLAVVEIVADKVPVVDSINDAIQTVIRPTAGGIVFGAGTSAHTATVTDPAEFFTSNAWIPVAIGIAIALVTHLTKSTTRAAATAVAAGTASPALSTGEDAVSIGLSVAAIFAPVLVIVLLLVGGLLMWSVVRSLHRRRQAAKDRRLEREADDAPGAPPEPVVEDDGGWTAPR